MKLLTLWRWDRENWESPELVFSADEWVVDANPIYWYDHLEKVRKQYPKDDFRVIEIEIPEEVVMDSFEPVKTSGEAKVVEETDDGDAEPSSRD